MEIVTALKKKHSDTNYKRLLSPDSAGIIRNSSKVTSPGKQCCTEQGYFPREA